MGYFLIDVLKQCYKAQTNHRLGHDPESINHYMN